MNIFQLGKLALIFSFILSSSCVYSHELVNKLRDFIIKDNKCGAYLGKNSTKISFIKDINEFLNVDLSFFRTSAHKVIYSDYNIDLASYLPSHYKYKNLNEKLYYTSCIRSNRSNHTKNEYIDQDTEFIFQGEICDIPKNAKSFINSAIKYGNFPKALAATSVNSTIYEIGIGATLYPLETYLLKYRYNKIGLKPYITIEPCFTYNKNVFIIKKQQSEEEKFTTDGTISFSMKIGVGVDMFLNNEIHITFNILKNFHKDFSSINAYLGLILLL
ncbi:hypothetical protein Cyrtocomes_01002 [Candidatus Cyrtobacter comes]|uniref:Outer membrane protein beta-barrel domain-containing protein n=1 Tax=Candidatus Cyrtobacter comes TaxID=675776 RepID=A0ABU5L912_9RICK|nr:hypothetical protein [Candidatus Cyrtobacter comes]MDZ5762611.1 hypothetical protein [Candidatus Cyrtobacter comes]